MENDNVIWIKPPILTGALDGCTSVLVSLEPQEGWMRYMFDGFQDEPVEKVKAA